MADKPRYRGIMGPDRQMQLQPVVHTPDKPRYRAEFTGDGKIRLRPSHENATEAPEAETLRIIGDQERGGPVPITYFPTPTSNPPDPRTAAAGYDRATQTLRVEWGDGGPAYNYYGVEPGIWRNFRRVKSPGKYINRVLNGYTYGPA
jgi:KTSC domain